jgi:tRNA A37 threonylcarbamoyladenosine dehydratase
VIVGECADAQADLERRFGGLRRLYGETHYAAMRAMHVGVVGLGGVGSWTVEALARSGVAALTLVDLDHVAESNINRQVQALGETLGQHKGEALRCRVADIHPGCRVQVVDAFVEPANVQALLPAELDVLVDACDQRSAKVALVRWAQAAGVPLVMAGAAGGKRQGWRTEVGDLCDVTHDPLLAAVRQQLRRDALAPRRGRMGVSCVFSREPVQLPAHEEACSTDGTLNCAGYGSSVTVTAAFGLAAAGLALDAARPLAGVENRGLTAPES